MFETIYSIFKIELDGEEFDTDEDALIAANLAMRDILHQRDWEFIRKTTTLAAGVLSFASITDLDKVTALWDDRREMRKGTFNTRFDEDVEYYVDHQNKTIVLSDPSFYINRPLTLDYTYKPVDMTATNTPIAVTELHAPIAYQMCLSFYRKDQDTSTYSTLENKLDKTMDTLINYNSSL